MEDKVKVCPGCGTLNEQYAYMCSNKNCKCSLMNVAEEESPVSFANKVVPEEESSNLDEKTFVSPTEALNNVKAYLEHNGPPVSNFGICSGDIAGRAGSIDLSPLKNSNFISGEHVQFFFSEGKWYIKNLSKTNKTLVNGEEVALECKKELTDGDHITMANTYFFFRVSE